MQQFRALLKKELGSYFNNFLAYIVLFFYLLTSIGSAFYFGSYLAMTDNSLFAAFYLQPFILTVIIPAITMKVWSDEYRLGTAEFLLTQPVDFYKFVLAKFSAATIFGVFMTVFLAPFIAYTSIWLKLDWGSIIADFIGLWMLIILFSAIGCLISSFNRNIILSYLFSVVCIASTVAFPFTHLYDTYINYLFAEIGFFEIFYFISLSAVFVFLNILAIEHKLKVQKFKTLKFCALTAGFLFCASALNYLFYILSTAKIDITSAGLYTPSEQSEKIVAGINQPLTIDLYIAHDFKAKNTASYYYYEQVKRFLNKYQSFSDGMISVNAIEVEPFSDLENIVLQSGLYFEENANGSKDYFGAVIRNNNSQTVIKQFLPQRQAYLEKDIDIALLKLTKPELIKTVGVHLDTTQNMNSFQGIMLGLENDYNVVAVESNTYEISPQLDLLILLNSKEFPSYFKYAVDQYLMRGGNILIFFDFLTADQSYVTNMKNIRVLDLFESWGVTLKDDLTDTGKLADYFTTSEDKLKIYKASMFRVLNKDLRVMPFIEHDNLLVGAVLHGKVPSAYISNPFINAGIAKDMMPHLIFSHTDNKIGIVGDVDLISDDNWIAVNSPDKNPYSIINSSTNGDAVKRLIDYMTGNEIYNSLPINNSYINLQNIGQQINDWTYKQHEQEYEQTLDAIKNKQIAMFDQLGGDEEKMLAFIQSGGGGQEFADLEKKLQSLMFKMKQLYSAKVAKIMVINIALWPLVALLLVIIGHLYYRRKQQKNIKELFND